MTPLIRYCVASPVGDLPVDRSRLDYCLEGDPLKTTYRTYFDVITAFLSRDYFRALRDAVNERLGTDTGPASLNEIIIRTEKHGALSHPASIECVLPDKRVKFGLHIAVTDAGKDSLRKEFETLKTLHARFSLPYIPVPYSLTEMNSMALLLEEWFEDFHEFHIANAEDGRQQIKLWEFGKGDRFLSSELSFEIYRQAAQILTLYYDLSDYRLIYPWHHAAGDFVVKIEDVSNPPPPPFRKGGNYLNLSENDKSQIIPPWEKGDKGGFLETIDVKLTTVRGYEPFMGFGENDMPHPALALFYFLLHLSIQMRLDRIDGVGDVVWADDYCVDAALTGFVQGIEKRDDLRDCCGSVKSFLMLLKSFTKEELGKTAAPMAEQFEKTQDYDIINKNLHEHLELLYVTLQNFP